MAPPEKPAKAMSSRLMNMKFMQRASASSPSTSDRGNQRPQKRQKLANESPASPSDAASLQSEHSTPKLNAEAEKYLERQAELAGETKWTLAYKYPPPISPALEVRQVGFNEIDAPSSDDDDDPNAPPRIEKRGRMKFGTFKDPPKEAKEAKKAKPDSDEDEASSSESGEEPTGPSSATPGKKRGRAVSESSDKVGSKKRKSGDAVDLRKLTSISNAGAPATSTSSVICYFCGQKGHMQSACRKARGPGPLSKGPWRGGHGKS